MSQSRRMNPADVHAELVDDAVDAWHEMPRPMALDDQMRHILAAVLPEFERQVRQKVSQDLLTVPMIEWVAARQNAGFDAARIARGES